MGIHKIHKNGETAVEKATMILALMNFVSFLFIHQHNYLASNTHSAFNQSTNQSTVVRLGNLCFCGLKDKAESTVLAHRSLQGR